MPGDAEARDANVGDLLGRNYAPLAEFGTQWGETAAAAIQNVLGRKVELTDLVFAATSYLDIIQEFSGIPHAAMEVKVSFGPNDAYLLGFLCPAPDTAALFDVKLDAATLADEEKLAEAAEAIRRTCAEMSDILGLMLFTDKPERADIAVGEVLFNRVEESVGIVADVAGEALATRLDIDTVLPEGTRSRLTTVLPLKFLLRLAEALAPTIEDASGPTAVDEPAPAVMAAPEFGAGVSGHRASTEAPIPDNLSVHPARFTPLPIADMNGAGHTLDLILDVTLRITVELGRNSMSVADVLGLGPGSVVELDRQAGEPVDILVNEKLIARGEVVVVEENFGVRILEIVSPQNRVAVLG